MKYKKYVRPAIIVLVYLFTVAAFSAGAQTKKAERKKNSIFPGL
jgi:hypothetical protein